MSSIEYAAFAVGVVLMLRLYRWRYRRYRHPGVLTVEQAEQMRTAAYIDAAETMTDRWERHRIAEGVDY